MLATAVTNGSWEVWKQTTRFIVDAYHYINHRVEDYLCRKYCNPSPGDELLVIVIVDIGEVRQLYDASELLYQNK